MAKTDLLNFLKDINYVYNDCGMYDCVSKMLEDFEAEIRAKAIDEFAKRVRHKIMSEIDECADELEWITEIEWQLKEE